MVIYITASAWYTVTSEDGITWYATLSGFKEYHSGEPPHIIKLQKEYKKWKYDAVSFAEDGNEILETIPATDDICNDICNMIGQYMNALK
jgi:hypothetical protein